MLTKQSLCITLFFLNIITLYVAYPLYKNIDSIEKDIIQKKATSGGYLSQMFTENIRTSVSSILELGSRDAIDALKLSEYYKCHVFAFECNPSSITVCNENIGNNPNITFIPYAVWNKSELISFFPMIEVPGIFYNPGASSCFSVDREGHHKTYIQTEITVQAIRLDEWLKNQGIDFVDMLCIDLQGATFQALEGMGEYLKDVKYIISEIEHKTIYSGEVLYSDIEKFLDRHGFQMYVGSINRFFGDYLFVRKDLVRAWDELN